MRKVFFKIIILFCLFIININVFALDIYSSNAIMYNLNDDSVIYEKGSNDEVRIASLTKIMTTIVAIENIDNLDEDVIMPSSAYAGLEGYALSGIKAFDKVTYRDLLYGIMLPSGADCANAIAILTAGSVSNFVDMMNEKATELKLINTHFSNPIGKDDNNYSSVSDLAILLKYALKNDEFYKIFTTREYTTTNNVNLKSTLITKSKGLDVSNIIGSKTGFTDDAGNCLASISIIDNVKYLLVTVGANTAYSYHIMDAINLYDYYSKNYGYKRILKFDQLIDTIKINNLFKEDYFIKSNSDLYLYLSNDISIDGLKYEYEGLDLVNSNMKKGDLLGKVNIKNGDQLLFTYDVFLDRDIVNYNYFIICLILMFVILSCMFLFRRRDHEI